jgi:O-antigen/teichoic acid export membrane protein
MVEDRKPTRAGNDQSRKIVIFSDIHHRINNSEFAGRVSAMSLARSFPTISAFIVLFVLARYLLEPSELAHYRKLWPFFSLWGPVVISAIVNAAYYRGSNPELIRATLRQTVVMFFFGGLLVGGSAWILSDTLAAFFKVPFLVEAYAIFGIYSMVAIWGSAAEPVFVLSGKRGSLPLLTALFTLFDMAAILIPFWMGADLITVVKWMILAQLARQLFLVPLFAKWFRELPTERVKTAFFDKTVLLYAGGMALLSLSGVGAAEIDRFIVGRFLDDTAFILYDIGARKLPFVTILTASVTSAIVAGYAAHVSRGEYSQALHKIKRSTTGLIRLLLPSVVFLAIAAEPFVVLIFGESYAGSGVVFAWFLIALLSNAFFPQSLIMATGRVNVNVIGAVGELVVNIGLSLILVRDFGIAGVAFSTAVAHWMYTFAMAAYCRVKLGVQASSFLPEPLGWSFYALLAISAALALLSLGFSDVLVLAFYVPIGIMTLIISRKFI